MRWLPTRPILSDQAVVERHASVSGHSGEASMEDWQVDRSIPFIETHHHLWELGRFPYGWLADPGTPGHNATLGDYKLIRTDWAGKRFFREFYGQHVIKSVHVEGDSGAPDPVDETRWLDGISREHGMPNALVVYCDLERGDAPAELDRHLAASDLVRGVRIRSQPDDADTPAFHGGLRALEERGLSYELNASPGKLLSGLETAKAHPGLQVILGHAGFPTQRDDEYHAWWKREISALAEAPNVACKVSGLGMVDHDWTIDSIRPWVMHCVEAFGVERTMFGTNWPVDILYSTYLQQVDAYRVIIDEAGISRPDQEKLLYRNAERSYRL
jgi:predicted TIM-barrel fold metal-dependent hydrolase